MSNENRQAGDVFQINELHGRNEWIGAFVLATEIKSWGIQGFVHSIQTHNEAGQAYIRLNWDEIDFIGRSVLQPTPHPVDGLDGKGEK